MAISNVVDFTSQLNAASLVNIDMSGWDTAVVQLVGPSGTVNFLSSNDNGEPTTTAPTFSGNPLTAINFTAIQGVNLATGTAGTSIATGGLMKFSNFGRFLQISGTTLTATKLLVFFSKIN